MNATIDYRVIYSRRKTLALEVKDGALIVRAPIGVSRERIAKMLEDHRAWIVKSLAKSEAKAEALDDLSDAEIAFLKKLAHRVLPAKTAYFASKMGVSYGKITITSAKGRFGSCSSKGDIAYSWRLLLYPEDAVDYVVVHELAHRKEMNHSDKFYAEVAKVFPDYRRRRKLLKGTPKMPELP